MIYSINKDVVFVPGAKRGAIYAFGSGKVYSINEEGLRILTEYVQGVKRISDEDYLRTLENNFLISAKFTPTIFIPPVKPAPTLEMAWIEITQKCNLKCVHCYEGNEHLGYSETLSLDEWKDVIEQLSDLHIKRLIIIGGEPCCHRDINAIIDFAAQFNFDITLFTNATLINDKLFNTIVRNGIRVKVSLYGFNSATHDKITLVKGSFTKLENNVKKLIGAGIEVTASIVAMRENEEYIQQVIEYAKSIGMVYKRYDVIRDVYNGTQRAHAPVTEAILNKTYMQSPNFSTTNERFNNCFNINSCWYGKISVIENGDVVPCEFERAIVYGNVKNQSISDIIHSENTLNKWYLSFDQIETCKDCEYRYACKDCRPLALSVCNDLLSKNPRCLYNPYTGEWGKK